MYIYIYIALDLLSLMFSMLLNRNKYYFRLYKIVE
jgi:hypothetical protein